MKLEDGNFKNEKKQRRKTIRQRRKKYERKFSRYRSVGVARYAVFPQEAHDPLGCARGCSAVNGKQIAIDEK